MSDLDKFVDSLFDSERRILNEIKSHLDDGYITLFDKQYLYMIRSSIEFLKNKLGR